MQEIRLSPGDDLSIVLNIGEKSYRLNLALTPDGEPQIAGEAIDLSAEFEAQEDPLADIPEAELMPDPNSIPMTPPIRDESLLGSTPSVTERRIPQTFADSPSFEEASNPSLEPTDAELASAEPAVEPLPVTDEPDSLDLDGGPEPLEMDPEPEPDPVAAVDIPFADEGSTEEVVDDDDMDLGDLSFGDDSVDIPGDDDDSLDMLDDDPLAIDIPSDDEPSIDIPGDDDDDVPSIDIPSDDDDGLSVDDEPFQADAMTMVPPTADDPMPSLDLGAEDDPVVASEAPAELVPDGAKGAPSPDDTLPVWTGRARDYKDPTVEKKKTQKLQKKQASKSPIAAQPAPAPAAEAEPAPAAKKPITKSIKKPPLKKAANLPGKKPITKSVSKPSGGGGFTVFLTPPKGAEKKQKAAELIADIQGISVDEAVKLAGKMIVPVVKGVEESEANSVRDRFKDAGFSCRITQKR